MIVPQRYRFCGTCGKPLTVLDKGKTQEGFDRMTGKALYVHVYVLVCEDYESGYSDGEWHIHDKFIYHDPVEE